MASHGMIPHDSGMVADVGGRSDRCEDFSQGTASSDRAQFAFALQVSASPCVETPARTTMMALLSCLRTGAVCFYND